jgi:hypothetical protein
MFSLICGSSLVKVNSPSYALDVRQRRRVSAVSLVRGQNRVTLKIEVERNTPILLIADACALNWIVTFDGLVSKICRSLAGSLEILEGQTITLRNVGWNGGSDSSIFEGLIRQE